MCRINIIDFFACTLPHTRLLAKAIFVDVWIKIILFYGDRDSDIAFEIIYPQMQ